MSAAGGTWAVVPALDEAATVGDLVARVRRVCPVVVVDDASGDDSAAAARAAGALVVRHPRRGGKGAALRTGFAEALRRGAERVATLDADGQHDPDDLPRLLAAAGSRPDALVLGDRLGAAAGDPMPAVRRGAVRAADRLLGALLGRPVRDSQCGYRVYPGSLLRRWPLVEEGFVLETEALVVAVRAGHPLVSVPVRRIYPPGRRSRFRGVADGIRVGWFLARALARSPVLVPAGPAAGRGLRPADGAGAGR